MIYEETEDIIHKWRLDESIKDKFVALDVYNAINEAIKEGILIGGMDSIRFQEALLDI